MLHGTVVHLCNLCVHCIHFSSGGHLPCTLSTVELDCGPEQWFLVSLGSSSLLSAISVDFHSFCLNKRMF